MMMTMTMAMMMINTRLFPESILRAGRPWIWFSENSEKWFATFFSQDYVEGGMKKIAMRFSTNISLNLGNDTRQSHSTMEDEYIVLV